MRVLIIGGYGTFGGRLVDLLRDEARLTLMIAGRNPGAAEAFCAARKGSGATLLPVRFDRADGVEAIRAMAPDIVVDAAGPFQLYGDDPYAAIRSTLEAGAHWIDLADGAAFVAGIGVLDETARAANRFVLAGASSFPVLTAAVLRRLSGDIPAIETCTAGIAPSPHAGVGYNVIRAIASYAGQPIEVLEDGKRRVRYGLISSRRMTVRVPGKVPLSPIRFALVDVPDLEVLPKVWPRLASVWVGAGPTPALLHSLLWLASWPVRWKIIPSLLPIARLMDWVVNTVRWGDHRGGMIVEATGEGRKASWHMLAEGDAGPLIPSMAIEAIIRKCLDGQWPPPGARSAQGEVELHDYEAMFARRGIVSGSWSEAEGTLYQAALGSAFQSLPEPTRQLHSFVGRASYYGMARIAPASNPLARLVAGLFGFPSGGDAVQVVVELAEHAGVETWIRSFSGQRMRSTQAKGRGRYDGLLVECFGPTRFGMAVTVENGRLVLVLRRWDLLGIPMPRFAMPKVTAFEEPVDGKFGFLVEIAIPLLGRLVRYEGWLVSSDRARSA